MKAPVYHSDRYVADPNQPRALCPCRCGKLLNPDAWAAVVRTPFPTIRRPPEAWKGKAS